MYNHINIYIYFILYVHIYALMHTIIILILNVRARGCSVCSPPYSPYNLHCPLAHVTTVIQKENLLSSIHGIIGQTFP